MHGEEEGAAMKKEDQVGVMVRGMGPDSDQKTKKEQPEWGAPPLPELLGVKNPGELLWPSWVCTAP